MINQPKVLELKGVHHDKKIDLIKHFELEMDNGMKAIGPYKSCGDQEALLGERKTNLVLEGN